MPFVSVIVPVFDQPKELKVCLHSLEIQTYPRHRYEVVVVDNGSTCDVQSVVSQFFQARYVLEKTPGSYAARNAGVAVSQGSILAFTDADCIPATDWISKGVSRLAADPQTPYVGGQVVLVTDETAPNWVTLYQRVMAFPQQENIRRSHYSVTANLLVDRQVVEAVGPFIPELLSCGDLEWGQRVHAAGIRQNFAAEVVVRHPSRTTFENLRRKYVRVTGGQVALSRVRRSSRWALLARIATAPLRRLCDHWGSEKLSSAREWVIFLGMEISLTLCRLCEALRVLLGGQPKRA